MKSDLRTHTLKWCRKVAWKRFTNIIL